MRYALNWKMIRRRIGGKKGRKVFDRIKNTIHDSLQDFNG